jgi:hypothetical protein
MKTLLVIARNYDQYANWIHQRALSNEDWRYVNGIDSIRGIENPHGIFIGTWYERWDIHDILIHLVASSRVENPELRKAIDYYEDKRYEPTN